MIKIETRRNGRPGASIVFRPNQDKILEALVWLANERPGLDQFHVAKVLFYADKEHLNRFGRPILGDTYWAMEDGPAPSLALDLTERDSRHLTGDLLEKSSEALSYDRSRDDNYLHIRAKRAPNLDLFSRTDIECLSSALRTYGDMPMKELWNLVHKEPSYLAIYRQGSAPAIIGYELFLDRNDPHYEEVVAELQESALETLL